jgi:uncharacterized protein HemY
MIRFILYILLFFVVYSVVKLFIKFLNSPSKSSIHTSNIRRNKNKYENIEDAEFTEIKSDGEKKNN